VPAQWQTQLEHDAVFTHVLTHKDLHLHPWRLSLPDDSLSWPEGRWMDAHEWPGLGLPAPIRKLLQRA
jgi:A/G-specific adenine glycosylase